MSDTAMNLKCGLACSRSLIGTCSLCHGPVSKLTNIDPPFQVVSIECESCGAKPKYPHGPVIEMACDKSSSLMDSLEKLGEQQQGIQHTEWWKEKP